MTPQDEPTCRPASEMSDADLVDVLLQVYARACNYKTKVLHDRWVECRGEVLKRLTARAPLLARIESLEADKKNLRSTMIAAAEEIHLHWDAHRDAEGYGPTNLMHRLESGIAAEYGYTSGAFAELKEQASKHCARIAELESENATMKKAINYAAELKRFREQCDRVLPAPQTNGE
jgi:hypothetical protein